ncbi:MAG: bifunctional glutamate N-acetyltransferase/amino-acid acetyltransferase ArgJ [Candidatus Sumerlaeia bacterium]
MPPRKSIASKSEKNKTAVPIHVPGFRCAAVPAGLKKNNQLDLALIVSERPCSAAAVFTTNRVIGEPVRLDQRHLKNKHHSAIVVNSKISNVCTGRKGYQDAVTMATRVAQGLNCSPGEVFVASTGIIGAPLPMDKIDKGITAALGKLSEKAWEEAAKAIMTTDTRPKTATKKVSIGKHEITIAGIAKGSGMIHPNMATMLCFIATDVDIEKNLLQDILHNVANRSFNCVTIDGDTSTSDTMIVMANGMAGNRKITENGSQAKVFAKALLELSIDLSKQIARDGEGAEHLLNIHVSGTRSHDSARKVALSVANSPLVKTAFYGKDANWGRLAMAVGKAGVPFSQENLSLSCNGFSIFKDGAPVEDYDEKALTKTLKNKEIDINISIGSGLGSATVWTCDMTHEYISINADYRS